MSRTKEGLGTYYIYIPISRRCLVACVSVCRPEVIKQGDGVERSVYCVVTSSLWKEIQVLDDGESFDRHVYILGSCDCELQLWPSLHGSGGSDEMHTRQWALRVLSLPSFSSITIGI